MRNATSVSVAGAILLPLSAAWAEVPPPVISPVDICVESGGFRVVSPRKLASWIIRKHKISDGALDVNGDGATSYEEKVSVLSDPVYCKTHPKNCSDTDDSAVSGAFGTLNSFIRNQTKYPSFKFMAAGGGSAVAPPAAPAAQSERTGRLTNAELLDSEGRFVRIACIRPEDFKDVQDKPVVPTKLAPPLNRGPRLAGRMDDLQWSHQGARLLKSVKAATFNLEADRQAKKTTINITAFAGFAFDVFPKSGTDRIIATPFAQVERTFTKVKENRVNKLGVGLLSEFWIRVLEAPTFDRFLLTPHYVTDDRGNTKIGTIKLGWTPGLLYQEGWPIGIFVPYGDLIALNIKPELKVHVGRVFDSGGNDEVKDKSTFTRVGGSIRATFVGAKVTKGTLLEDFELMLEYNYFRDFSGKFRNLHFGTAALNYVFPGQDNVLLSAEYSRGRVEDTLEKTNLFKVSLGVRF